MDSINPQNTQSELQKAIEQIKQWQKEGKTQDALQGCNEILEIAPDNMEIKTIMQSLQTPTTVPISTPVVLPKPDITPRTIPTPEKPDYDIATPENPLYSAINQPSKPEEKTVKKKTSHGIVLNLLIIMGTILILGGGTYAYLKFFAQNEDVTIIDLPKEDIIVTTDTVSNNEVDSTDTITDEKTTEDTELTARNEQRFSDLTEMETVIKSYYNANGKYPNALELEGFVSSYDPLDGTTDENGQIFAYSYAVYDTDFGNNQEYILAGLFEDENGENTIWTTGANPQDHPNYRDGTAENFIMITAQSTTTNTQETKPKVKVKK